MDKFKIGLLVLGFGYLVYLFCPMANQVGRYSFLTAGSTLCILDTANAEVYSIADEAKQCVKINPKTGKARKVWLTTNK